MKKKKSHGVQLLIRCVVKNPNGRIISDTGQKPANSFVIQFLEFIYLMMGGAIMLATATDGTEDGIYSGALASSDLFQIKAPANNSLYGMVVGTGDTAEDNEDYCLETQLTEGVGAGNITHGIMGVGTTAVVGVNVDLVLSRSFHNLTGSAITVKEAGLYTKYSTLYYHCIIRDVLGTPVEVPDKCSLTVYYTVRTTV